MWDKWRCSYSYSWMLPNLSQWSFKADTFNTVICPGTLWPPDWSQDEVFCNFSLTSNRSPACPSPPKSEIGSSCCHATLDSFEKKTQNKLKQTPSNSYKQDGCWGMFRSQRLHFPHSRRTRNTFQKHRTSIPFHRWHHHRWAITLRTSAPLRPLCLQIGDYKPICMAVAGPR